MSDQQKDYGQQEGGQATMEGRTTDFEAQRPQSSYDNSFLEIFGNGGTASKLDAVSQALAYFDGIEQQARTARQTIWSVSLIMREHTQQIVQSLPPLVAAQVVEQIKRQYPDLVKR